MGRKPFKAKPAPIEMRREPTADWMQTNGTYIQGESALAEVDKVAREVEAKWGVDRVRLLVGEELRTKFDNQRFKLNAAIRGGDLEDVREQSERMCKAWRAVDRAATAAGAQRVTPDVWEVAGDDGVVFAIVRTTEEAHALVGDGRLREVWTLAEVARALQSFKTPVGDIKRLFPGARVVGIREARDPLLLMPDDIGGLDDTIPF